MHKTISVCQQRGGVFYTPANSLQIVSFKHLPLMLWFLLFCSAVLSALCLMLSLWILPLKRLLKSCWRCPYFLKYWVNVFFQRQQWNLFPQPSVTLLLGKGIMCPGVISVICNVSKHTAAPQKELIQLPVGFWIHSVTHHTANTEWGFRNPLTLGVDI